MIKNNTFKCIHNCQPVKCPNYLICEHESSEIYKLFDDNDLCTDCVIRFRNWTDINGLLKITDNVKCSMCSQITKNVSLELCKHTLCIQCFKNFYYDDDCQFTDKDDFDYAMYGPRCPLCMH